MLAQIGQKIMALVQQGVFTPAKPLPSERVLCEQFSVTRITLREALGQLASQGIIYSEPRRGWFVSPPRLVYNPLKRSHFHTMIKEQGRTSQTEVIEARQLTVINSICKSLGLPVGSSVYCVRRLRRIDERPVLYVEHYINPAIFPALLQNDLTQSLTDIYHANYNIHYGRVRFTMIPVAIPTQAISALKLSAGSPVLSIIRVNRDQNNRIIDCDYEYWRHDAIQIDVEI